MFVNMDMVNAAGFDESFADTWPTFLEAVTKMTKPGKTYGFGIGIQIGGYGEWYQRLRAAGGSYLTPDHKTVNVNHPDVVLATQQFADLFKKGIAPPLGTYTYDDAPAAFAAGKMAIYSSDLATTTTLPAKVPFNWKLLPYPPGPVSRVNFNDLSLYMINPQSSDQDLMWEVLKWWTSAPNDAYWAGNSGTYPAQVDAPQLRLQQVGGAPAGRGIRVVPEVRRRAGELPPVGRCRERCGGRDPELLRRKGDGAAGR